MASNTTEPDSDDSFYKSRRKTRRRRVSSVSSDDSVIARPHRRKKCRVSSSSSDSDDSLLARPSRKKCKVDALKPLKHRVLSESESDSTLTSDSEEEILQRNQRRPQRNVVVSDSEGTSPEKSSPVAINSVTADLNSSDSDEGEKCIICFKSLKPPFGNPSNCSHHFHPKCLATWSKTSNTCPIDRVKYTAIHVVDSRGDLVSREAVTTPPPQDHNADFEPDDATFCEVCSQHDREHEMLLCDRCEAGYHLDCLTPPLREVPDGNWFCPICTELGNELAAEMNVLMDDAAIILESRMRQRSSTSTRMPSRPRTRGAQRVFNIIHHQQSADQPSTSSVTIRRQRASSHRVRRSKSRRPQSTRYKVELITVEDGTTLEVKVAVNTRTRTKSKKHSRRKSKKKCSKSHRSDGPSTSRDAIFTGEGPSRPLDLFGSRPQLDYFSGCEAEDELDEDGGRGGGVVALRCPRPGVRNMASRKQIAAQILNSRPRRPAPTRIEVSRAPVDLVSSIIEQQEKWHSPGASYQSTSNGDIRVIMKESRTSRIRQAGGSGEGSSNNAPSTSAQTFSSSGQPTRDAGSSGSGSASGSQGTSNAPHPSSSSSSRTCGDGDLSKSSGSSERVPSPKIPSSSAMDKEEKDADEDSLCVKSRGKLEPDSPSKPSHHNPNVLETDEEEINKRVGYGKSTSDIHSPSQCLRSAEQYEVPPRSPSVEESNSIQGIQSRMSEENAVSGNDSEHSNDDEAPLADIGSVTDSPSGDQRVPEDLSMKKTCDSKENTVSNTKKGNCLNVASKTIDKVDCDKQDAAPEQERIINEEDAFDEKPEDLSMVESGVLEKNETDEPGHVVKEEFKSQQDDSNLSDPVSAVVRESVDEVQSAEYNADDVDIQEIDRQSECDNEDFPTKNYTDVENLTNKRDVEESTETEASLDDDSSVKARDDVKDELQDVDAEIKDNDVGDTEDDSKHSVNDGKVNLSQDDAGGRSVDDDTEDVDANDSSVTLSRDDVGVKDVDGNTDCDDADVGAYGKVRLINDNNVNFAQVGVTDGEDVTNAVADYVKLKDDVDAGVTDDDNGVDVKAVVDGVKLKEDVDADVKDDANAVDVKLKEDVDADVKDDDNAVDVKLKDDVDPNVKDDGMGVDVKLKDDVDADVKDDDMVADVKLKDDVDADLKDDDNGTDVGDGSNVPCINDSNANSECATVDSEVSNEKVPTTHDISSCLTAAGKDEGLNDKNSLLDSNLSELSDGELADEFNEERPSISSSTNNANLDDQLSKFGPSSAEIGGYQLQCSNNENQEIPNLMTDSKHEDPAHKSSEDKSGMDSCKKELNCENEQEAHGENGDLLEIGCEEEKDGLVDITDEEISNYERSWEMEENGEKTKKEGLEGLETEAISDCDSQSVDPEVPQRKESEEVLEFQPINQVTEETSKEEEGEIVTEEGSPVQKNKTLKERNYRGDMKKKDSAQNNDKQSEPERYEARRVIMEKPHKKGERRDVSSDSESTSLSSSIGRSISREKMSRSKSRSRSRGRVKDKRARDRSREHSKSRSRERNKVRSVSREKNRRNRSRDRQSRSRSRKRRRSRTPRRDRGRSRERSSRERRKRKRSLSSSCSSCSCSSCEREKKRNKKLTVIVPNEGKNRERSRDRGKNKKDKRRRSRSRNRKRKTPVPSKEVFTSGNNILVSVNFKSSKAAEESARGTETAPTSKRKKDDEARKKKDKRTKENQPMRSIVTKKNTSRRRKINTSNMKPVAIIDLDASPFRETTLSPKEIIILTDSDDEDKLPRTEPAMQMSGPKTPPEPHIKFSIANNSKQQQQLRGLPNPLMDKAGREDDDVMHIGPNTPPEPSAAYDPFEPTKSRSPSPGPTSRSDRIPSPPSDAKQRHSPLQSQISMTPPKLSQHDSPKTPSPLQSMPKDMDDLPDKNKQPPFQPAGLDSGDDSGGGGGGDSPYSPGSSEGDDLFEPPMPQSASIPKPRPRPMAASQSNKSKPPPPKVTINTQKRSNNVSKEPSKKGPARKDMGLKLDEDQLKILDDLPNSAVEMQVKDKFLKKLNRQERVVEEVKLVLKPHYAKKHVSKEEYKEILRRSVPKICHSRSGEINPMKIQRLVEAYVKKYRHRMKRKGVAPAIAPLRQNKPVVVKNQWA